MSFSDIIDIGGRAAITDQPGPSAGPGKREILANWAPAGDAPAFAQTTARLLTDPQLNSRLRVIGRASVEERYAWQAVYRKVDEIRAGLGKVVQ